ncbi:MAG: c-type cytochrome [Deltaproteobacteria bacterium]|nr:c-type cytochrome [Deltaproteobacteria bacterium]
MADAERRVDPIQGEILHVYDGIEEADNQLPLWWLWTFYLAIAFAVLYWIGYHELKVAPLPMEAYSKALQERASGGEVSEELLTALVADPDVVGEGQTLFNDNCVVCHEARGQGNIGPNLTDEYWIHGGGPLDIHRTISEGVLDSGMPAWGGTLGADAVQKLAAFVLSIRDTNVEGKEPQGEVWTGGSGGSDAEGRDDAPEEALEAEDAPEDVQDATGTGD